MKIVAGRLDLARGENPFDKLSDASLIFLGHNASHGAGSCEQFAKKDYTLGLLKTQRSVHGVASFVFQSRIRGEFPTPSVNSPAFCCGNQRSSGAHSSCLWHDMDTFEKRDRRGIRSVNVIRAHRDLDKANRLTRFCVGNELGETLGPLTK
jgi:hypothetical protein